MGRWCRSNKIGRSDSGRSFRVERLDTTCGHEHRTRNTSGYGQRDGKNECLSDARERAERCTRYNDAVDETASKLIDYLCAKRCLVSI